MKKSINNTNALIKRKNLISALHGAGISRISPEAIKLLEEQINDGIKKMGKILKERMTIKGRKTLLTEDIKQEEVIEL